MERYNHQQNLLVVHIHSGKVSHALFHILRFFGLGNISDCFSQYANFFDFLQDYSLKIFMSSFLCKMAFVLKINAFRITFKMYSMTFKSGKMAKILLINGLNKVKSTQMNLKNVTKSCQITNN